MEDKLPAIPPAGPKVLAPYDEAAAFQVVELIAMGYSLPEIARRPGLPGQDAIVQWLMTNPELSHAVQKAREVSAFVLEDEALAMARKSAKDPGDNKALKALEALIKQLQWSAVKRNPQVYSEKSAVNVVVPVQINTSLDLGGDNIKQGTTQFPNIYALQAENIVEVPAELTAERPNPVEEPKRRKTLLRPMSEAELSEVERKKRIAEARKIRERVRLAAYAEKKKAAKLEAANGAGQHPQN